MLYGLDIGGTKIEIAAFDNKLNKLDSCRVETPRNSYEDFIATIVKLVLDFDNKFNCKGTVGIGIPGFINKLDNSAHVTNIAVAHKKPIKSDLEQRLDREVRIENDANCFALSEAWDSENQQYPMVLGLILGTGFGAGLVFDGKVFSGRQGMAGELGHLTLNYHALKLLGENPPIYPCGCGNKACLDTYLSGRGFEMLFHDLVTLPSLASNLGNISEKIEKSTAVDIIARFNAKDPVVVAFVDNYVEIVAVSLANIINALDPDVIICGGGLSNFDYLYPAVSKALKPHIMQSATVPTIKKAKYGDAGGARGAAALFLRD